MKPEIINNEDLHLEHNQWNMELSFWEDELKIFEKQLESVITSLTDKKALAELDHFQNQFRIHSDTFRELKEAVETHDADLAQHSRARINSIDRIRFDKHRETRDQMTRERQLYQDLKKEYYLFLSQIISERKNA